VTLLLFALFPKATFACKDRIYPPSFPVETLSEYSHVYVVHVIKVNPLQPITESRYAPPFEFDGRVLQSLKGPRKAGDMIHGETSASEEAHARCPISIEAGKDYLLMMTEDKMLYILPRYGSLYLPSSSPLFRQYVDDISRANKK
jgi:hypothetical protein